MQFDYLIEWYSVQAVFGRRAVLQFFQLAHLPLCDGCFAEGNLFNGACLRIIGKHILHGYIFAQFPNRRLLIIPNLRYGDARLFRDLGMRFLFVAIL